MRKSSNKKRSCKAERQIVWQLFGSVCAGCRPGKGISMGNAMFVLTLIGTVAAVVSAVVAVCAKNEVQRLVNSIKGDRNAQAGDVRVENKGDNQGVILGVNTGEIIQK